MSTEPDRDIEKTLKAYAGKRQGQAGTPLTMPSHTRATLQREAARLTPPQALRPSKSVGSSGLLANLWVRVAFAVVVVGTAGLLWRSNSRNSVTELAQNQPAHGSQFSFSKNTDESASGRVSPSPLAAVPPALSSAPEPTAKDAFVDAGKTQPEGGLGLARQPVLTASAAGEKRDLTADSPPPPSAVPVVPANASSLASATEVQGGSAVAKRSEAKQKSLDERTAAPAIAADSLRSRSAATVPPPGGFGGGGGTTSAATRLVKQESAAAAAPAAATAERNPAPAGAAGRRGGGDSVPPAPSPVMTINGPVMPVTVAPTSSFAFHAEASLDMADTSGTNSLAQSPLWMRPNIPPPEPVSLRGFSASALAGGTAVQQFAQLPVPVTANRAMKLDRTDKFTPPAPILQSFRMEQSGEQLRVIDADGSVYVGNIGKRDTPATADAGPVGRIAPSDLTRTAAVNAARQVYYFRVEGTNVTSKSLVRFSGDVIPSPEPSNAGRAAGRNSTSATQPAPPITHGQVQGQARVGSGPAIPINAFPIGN